MPCYKLHYGKLYRDRLPDESGRLRSLALTGTAPHTHTRSVREMPQRGSCRSDRAAEKWTSTMKIMLREGGGAMCFCHFLALVIFYALTPAAPNNWVIFITPSSTSSFSSLFSLLFSLPRLPPLSEGDRHLPSALFLVSVEAPFVCRTDPFWGVQPCLTPLIFIKFSLKSLGLVG